MTSTARRRLPGNCTVTSPDISVLALSRSSDAQWAAIERVARAAAQLLALRAPNGDGVVAFRVELADGTQQAGTVGADGAIHRDAAAAPTAV